MSIAAPQKVEILPMQLHFGPEVPLSDSLFLQLCRNNPDLRLERTAEGELIAMAPGDSESGARSAWLTVQLGLWSRHDKSGIAFDSSAGFTLPDGAIRAPDASWILLDRWEALSQADRKKFAPICPDFVVELLSPTDRSSLIREKMREYIENGARLGWLIDPERGVVEVYRRGLPIEELSRPLTLSGEDILPGFVLDLKGILFD